MKKPLFALAILIILLSACAQAEETPLPITFPTQDSAGSDSPMPVCQPSDLSPTPGPDEPSLFPAPKTNDWIRGPSNAVTTFIVYSDFQSAAGASLNSLLKQLQKELPADVRMIYRHAPKTDIHDKAMLAAQAAEAAGKQGKFWEMHDLLFSRQLEWIKTTPQEFKAWLIKQAASLDLDTARFDADIEREDIFQYVEHERQFAQDRGVLVTPFLLINGQIYNGPLEYESLDRIVRLVALGKRQFRECPPLIIDRNKEYTATLLTDKGRIVILLYVDKAPLTVNNFVFLARQGWYDQITWHRVLPNFIAQTGDPSATGSGGPGYFFRDEITPSLKFDRPGLVAMANYGPNTNGSQFFITYAPLPSLDGRHTIFGEVLSGMDVLKELKPRDPQPGIYLPPGDTLLSVTIQEQ